MKTHFRFLAFLLIFALALSTPALAFEELAGSGMGDAIAESQNEPSNSTDMTVPEDGENSTKVLDVWLNGHSIHMLTEDGVVRAIKDGRESILARDVVSVFKGTYDIYTLSDGSIALEKEHKSEYELDEEWNDLALVAANYPTAVGMKNNGTWISAGDYRNGECDVEDWTDIIQLECGYQFTVGLKSDGTVVATGMNNKGQCNVSGWTDIVKIAVGTSITLGLKSDGTVVATGNDYNDMCFVGRWKNVIDIFAGTEASYGLTKDGEVLCTANGAPYQYVPKGYTCEMPKRIEVDDYGDAKTIIII